MDDAGNIQDFINVVPGNSPLTPFGLLWAINYSTN